MAGRLPNHSSLFWKKAIAEMQAWCNATVGLETGRFSAGGDVISWYEWCASVTTGAGSLF